MDLTWVPQLNTELALFLKRQGKALQKGKGAALAAPDILNDGLLLHQTSILIH